MRRAPCLGLTAIAVALAATAARAADRTCPIPTCDARLIAHRSIRAMPASPEMTIDGRLDERAWTEAPLLEDLMQSRPTPGAASRLKTEARVLVDDAALYIGIRLRDPNPLGIVAPYFRRDNE